VRVLQRCQLDRSGRACRSARPPLRHLHAPWRTAATLTCRGADSGRRGVWQCWPSCSRHSAGSSTPRSITWRQSHDGGSQCTLQTPSPFVPESAAVSSSLTESQAFWKTLCVAGLSDESPASAPTPFMPSEMCKFKVDGDRQVQRLQSCLNVLHVRNACKRKSCTHSTTSARVDTHLPHVRSCLLASQSCCTSAFHMVFAQRCFVRNTSFGLNQIGQPALPNASPGDTASCRPRWHTARCPQ